LNILTGGTLLLFLFCKSLLFVVLRQPRTSWQAATPRRSEAFALVLMTMAMLDCGVVNAEPASTLHIRIENVSPKGGDLVVALFVRENYDGHDGIPVIKVKVPAVAPVTLVHLGGLKPGVYAVKMFQDIERSDHFVTTALGLPAEPFGFSNDALPLLDQPSFDRAKFELRGSSMTIVVHLRSGV